MSCASSEEINSILTALYYEEGIIEVNSDNKVPNPNIQLKFSAITNPPEKIKSVEYSTLENFIFQSKIYETINLIPIWLHEEGKNLIISYNLN